MPSFGQAMWNLAQPPWGTAGGRALGDGWGSEQSSKLNDGAGLGIRKDCDGVRIGSVSERLWVGMTARAA